MFLLVILFSCSSATVCADEQQGQLAGAQNKYGGQITGTVTSTKGDPIRGALVEAYAQKGRILQDKPSAFAFSDQKGKYLLDLPVGTYTLKIKAPKFRERELGKVIMHPAGEANIPIKLLADVPILIDEMKVVAKIIKKTSEKVQLAERKAATNVVDNIGAETIAKTPESDVAGIITRMPGVILDQGKYMQARGMSKRYNNTTLNGSIVPSTRANEKLTPLDLFPTYVVDSISVVKTFSPDLAANFSGGLCQIKTKALPESLLLKLGYTVKYNNQTTGEKYQSYDGGSKDWAGYDDGTRELPKIIPGNTIQPGGVFTKGYSDRQIEKFGESFNNTWNIHEREAHPQSDYEFVAGDKLGEKFGLVMSTYYKSDIQNYNDEQKTIYTLNGDGSVRPDSSYKFKQSRKFIKEGGLFNFGFDFNADNKLVFTNFYNRSTTDEARTYEGYNSDRGDNIRVGRLRYIEEEFYSGGVAGDHKISELLNSRIKWRYNFSLARMDDPDMRQNTYEYNGSEKKYVLSTDTESLLRMFTNQDEDMDDMAIDWSLDAPSPWSWLVPKFQFGSAYTKRNRDFESRRFAFRHGYDMKNVDLSDDPEILLQPWNINQYDFHIEETSRPTDKYTAEEKIAAVYAMLDLTLLDTVQLVGGTRIEREKTTMVTKDPFNPSAILNTRIHDSTWHPSIELKYSPIKDMNVRLGYSSTLSRPEFHELAPFEFTDVIGGSAQVGNPNLKVAKIKNYDFRWEWFLNQQDVLSASLFYKKLTNAIEPTIQATTQLRSSYVNADDAWLKGAEFEVRKNLGFIWPGMRHWNITSNYIWTDSETTISPKVGFVPTTATRPLVGQPKHMVNAALEYDNPDWGFTARFMYQFTHERVNEIGGLGLPDIIEKKHDRFDLVLIKNFGKHWDVKLAAQNLNNEPYTLTQGGQDYYTYKVGRTFKLGVSWKW